MADIMVSNTTLQIWSRATNALGKAAICVTLLCTAGNSARSDDATQMLVFIRHGEKPDEGLGQLIPILSKADSLGIPKSPAT
jgi:hypothetical protein